MEKAASLHITPEKNNFLLNAVAQLFSIVLHPLFIPSLFFYWIWRRIPYEFAGMTFDSFKFRWLGVFWTTAFFPAFVVFLLRRLKAVESIRLRHAKERIIPYICTMFFYWWMWYLSRNFQDQPLALKFFYFGIFLATVPALILNNFFKISMHGMGVGGLLAGIILTCYMYHVYLGADIITVLFLAAAVLSSRLYLGEHNGKEVYAGFVIGAFCQLVAYWVMV